MDFQGTKIDSDTFFESRHPNTVFEESDHEVVVVNLVKGIYYFLTGSAAFIWMGVHAGLTMGDLVSSISSLNEGNENAQADVDEFLQQLVKMNLLEIVTEHRQELGGIPNPSNYMPNGYQSPSLETYADLQDILLLDPVHDVDDAGWPIERTN